MKGIALDSIETAAITGNYYFGGDTLNHTRLHFLNSDNKFHTYVLEWEENEYRVYADSIHYFTFINERKGFMTWPFDQSFYLILNIACEANVGATEDIVEKELPQKMEIDYVRVYQIET
jgi:beta-glucanase (GH16 family)